MRKDLPQPSLWCKVNARVPGEWFRQDAQLQQIYQILIRQSQE